MTRPSMLRGLLSFGSMTMVSRVFGLVRDVVISSVFGANAGDRRLLGGVPDPQLHAPAVRRRLLLDRLRAGVHRDQGNPAARRPEDAGIAHRRHPRRRPAGDRRRWAWSSRPQVAMLFSPGAVRRTAQVRTHGQLLRLTFPFLLFVSLTALAGGVLNSFHRFGLPALTPVILNLCMIAGALWLAPLLQVPILALGWAILARRRAAVAVPAAAAGEARPARAAALGLAPSGRAQGDAADGADAVRLVGRADQPAARHGDRLVADRRLADLAVAGRPLPRTAAGRVRRRAGHGDPADAVAPPRQHRSRRVFEGARLGPAHDADDRGAGDARPDAAGRSRWWRRCSSTATSPRSTRGWRRCRSSA